MINSTKKSVIQKSIPVGYLYRIIDKKNGKTYIGMRTLARDTDGWRQYLSSSKLINNIIEKQGSDRFIKQFICYSWSTDELREIEYKAIKAEWAQNKGEYNITAYTPDPNNWRHKTNEEKAIIREKRIDALKKIHGSSDYINASHIKGEERYQEFLQNNNMNEILKEYKKLNSVAKTAKKYNVSRKYLSTYLRDNNITLNQPTVKGYKKTDVAKTIDKIARLKTLNKDNLYFIKYKICGYENKCCNYFYHSKRKFCNNCFEIEQTNKKSALIEQRLEVDRIVNDPNNFGKSMRTLVKENGYSVKFFSAAFDRNGIQKAKPGDTTAARKKLENKYNNQDEKLQEECQYCNKTISIKSLKRHERYCNLNPVKEIRVKVKRTTYGPCNHDGCDTQLAKKTSKYCKKHWAFHKN